MDDFGNDIAPNSSDMVSESVTNTSTELRKRRSTRIVQAVPLVVTGVDALGRPFMERTSSLIINCHGCRFQSKHYVLKIMWVKLEIPHPESGQMPRSVRGRVAWIERPRTVRQLFQVALELEIPGNVWGIAFPPEDWFGFDPQAERQINADLPVVLLEPEEAAGQISEHGMPAVETELPPPAVGVDNVRPFPAPSSTTDASLQLARQLTRLVAEAKQQLHSTAHDIVSQLAAAEQRDAFEQWEQKFAAARAEISNEAERVESAARAIEEAANQTEQRAGAHRESLQAEAGAAREQIHASVTDAKAALEQHVEQRLGGAQAQLQGTTESAVTAAQERLAATLQEHSDRLIAQLHESMSAESARHSEELRAAAARAAAEVEQRLQQARDAAQSGTSDLQATIERANAAMADLDQFLPRVASLQQQALGEFQTQLSDTLSHHHEELQRRSEALHEELSTRINLSFGAASHDALARFDEQMRTAVEPHVNATNEAVQRLAGGRSLLDAALTLQQERIRNTADEAFAESLARFHDNLGTVEQVLHESAQKITSQNLTELEGRAVDVRHHTVEEMHKSAEWYEKKVQTQIVGLTERAVEHAGNQLREKAGEISGGFATELDHSSRSFVQHTHTESEEVVRDAFDRARALFAEAADTTSAAFTDAIQRQGREELAGFGEAGRETASASFAQLQASRAEAAQQTTAQQEEIFRRFRGGFTRALER